MPHLRQPQRSVQPSLLSWKKRRLWGFLRLGLPSQAPSCRVGIDREPRGHHEQTCTNTEAYVAGIATGRQQRQPSITAGSQKNCYPHLQRAQ